jgi:hypothetical protein
MTDPTLAPQRAAEGPFKIRRYARDTRDGTLEELATYPQPDPMPPAEIGMIVDLVCAYTRREPDKSMIQVWGGQALVGRWTLPEASAAVHQWAANREPNAFLEPSDVSRAIHRARNDLIARREAQREAAVPGDPNAAARVAAMVASLAATKVIPASVDDLSRPHPRGLHVRCDGSPPVEGQQHDPGCGAEIGELCRLRAGKRHRAPGGFVHPSRMDRERAFIAANDGQP